MGSEVLLADVDVGVIVVAVLVVALEGALVAGGAIVALGGVAIVDGEDKAAFNGLVHGIVVFRYRSFSREFETGCTCSPLAAVNCLRFDRRVAQNKQSGATKGSLRAESAQNQTVKE